jgi:hypothetical protein
VRPQPGYGRAMRGGAETERRRASGLEVLGAWLHVWTPPRDVDVPPVPWRKVLLYGAGAAVVIAAALALIVPRIDAGKDRAARSAAAHDAAVRAARRARILHEQRPRHASAAALRPPAGAPPARQRVARLALLTAAEGAVSRDAAARVRRGELDGRIGRTTCGPVPGGPPAGDLRTARSAFDCFTETAAITATAGNLAGSLAYPFRVVVDWQRFSYTWCKANPIPGERVVPDPSTVVDLPAACRLATS